MSTMLDRAATQSATASTALPSTTLMIDAAHPDASPLARVPHALVPMTVNTTTITLTASEARHIGKHLRAVARLATGPFEVLLTEDAATRSIRIRAVESPVPSVRQIEVFVRDINGLKRARQLMSAGPAAEFGLALFEAGCEAVARQLLARQAVAEASSPAATLADDLMAATERVQDAAIRFGVQVAVNDGGQDEAEAAVQVALEAQRDLITTSLREAYEAGVRAALGGRAPLVVPAAPTAT